MNVCFLYPSNYFDITKVEEDYEKEQITAKEFGFKTFLFSYDEFIKTKEIKLYPKIEDDLNIKFCIYRGWMLKSEDYSILYNKLLEFGIQLINTPSEYTFCHEFPNVYPEIKYLTPEIFVFEHTKNIPWDNIKERFDRFLIKDFVKSVKGYNFPLFFDRSFSNDKLDSFVDDFLEFRGELFVKGLVFKKYVDLKKYNGKTNEYRVFYFNGNYISITPNSEQENTPTPPMELILKVNYLNSKFYTVDFAELENGEWIILETGDGQVSGLPSLLFPHEFYEKIKRA